MKNSVKIIMVTFIALMFNSCKSENVNAVMHTSVVVQLTNSNGGDLLNPEYNGGIKESNISHYHLKDGVLILQYDVDKAMVKNLRIDNGSGEKEQKYSIRVVLATPDESGYSTSVLQYNNGFKPDTVSAKFYIGEYSLWPEKIFWNNQDITPIDVKEPIIILKVE